MSTWCGRCMRGDEAFGVVLIAQRQRYRPRRSAQRPIGTSARIVDFQTLEDGLLGCCAAVSDAFASSTQLSRADGLNRAEVEWLPEAGGVCACAEVLSRWCRCCAMRWRSSRPSAGSCEPDYEDACWVSYRLAELLPLRSQSAAAAAGNATIRMSAWSCWRR